MAKDMGNLFITFLLIVIALALTPTVADAATTAAADLATPYPAAETLCKLIPLFWIVIIIAIGVAAIYVQFKGWGA